MSKLYMVTGELLEFESNPAYPTPFLRKMLKPSVQTTRIELKIASIIQQNPHPNLVKVYKISKSPPFIDYQLLETNYKIAKKEQSNYIDNIRQGTIHLHKFNVVYIDFKNSCGDNVGYDKISKTYRMYDFDASGVTKGNKKEWMKLYTPPEYFNYKTYLTLCNQQGEVSKTSKEFQKTIADLCKKESLTKIDEVLFYLDYNELLLCAM